MTSWTSELIQELQEINNKASQDVEVWLDSILEGYITEFVVDTNMSFSEAEREFFSGPQDSCCHCSCQLSNWSVKKVF